MHRAGHGSLRASLMRRMPLPPDPGMQVAGHRSHLRRSHLCKQRTCDCVQFRKPILSQKPNTFRLNGGIAMNRQVPEVDYFTPWRNTFGDFGAGLMQAVQGLADDLELALDGRLRPPIAIVGLDGAGRAPPRCLAGGNRPRRDPCTTRRRHCCDRNDPVRSALAASPPGPRTRSAFNAGT